MRITQYPHLSVLCNIQNKKQTVVKVSKRQVGLSGVALISSYVCNPYLNSVAEFLRSLTSKSPGVLTIRNNTDDTLKAYWVNYDGDQEFYSAISPGQEWTVDTFESHPWRIVDADKDGVVVKEYIAQAGDQYLNISDNDNNDINSNGYMQNGSTRPLDQFEGFDGLGGNEQDYARAKVGSVQVDPQGGLVLLKIEGEKVPLPIYVGYLEVLALMYASGMETRRPMTVKTWIKSLELANTKVEKMLITRIVGETYYARIVLQLDNGGLRWVDARPSDGLAIALAADKPVFVARQVIESKLGDVLNENRIQGPGKKSVIIPQQGSEV
eukprot:TRINITY_DN8804_c0_g1_i1.p1 TRINITY_DN8804_c0_g1~~TRINITY_DN8804_c0_g1_i1.p1  ORF type:complete len:325 (+),score=28.29 TRINITY_DN8804_c0_g1_i1:117-1091(+)